ncbi:SLC13 family permease [Rhodococcus sp. NPDC060090]|uniref:SLC13 family permease n=1 Tax=Rhodococcus sp. NPDC060090 TaxID=3347056 RepID=UPI00364F2DD8
MTYYSTTPPRVPTSPTSPTSPSTPPPRVQRRAAPGRVAALAVLVAACAGIVHLARTDAALSAEAAVTLIVFVIAVWLWIFTRVDDTYVALGAAAGLTVVGVADADALFATLGDDIVWLLLSAFVIAAGVASSGLATRGAAFLVTGARTPRALIHLVTAALVVTAFAVPSTSGRAALVLPVFVAIAAVLSDRPRLVRALALLFPTVILLSAVASLLGAGAHLITSQIVATATGAGFDFATWMLLGLPLAIVSSHAAAELVLRMFTAADDRRRHLTITAEDIEAHSSTPVTGPFTVAESRSAVLLAVVTVLWCTEPLHGIHPAVVALLGALVAASPRYGSVRLGAALKTVPWSLLLFMAATLSIGTALTTSGAADWLANTAFGPLTARGAAAGPLFVVVVVVVSTAAHLVIQSRSARSAVLIPVVVALAPTVGVDPLAAAFISTAAAGFCHTLPSSAKPVTLFSSVPDVPTYTSRDLLRLSAVLGPLSAVLVLLFAWFVWPLLGMPLFP